MRGGKLNKKPRQGISWYRRVGAAAFVVVAFAALFVAGYASPSGLLGSAYSYGYQYCSTPGQYQYCSTTTSTSSTTTTTTTTPTTTTQPTSTSTSTRSTTTKPKPKPKPKHKKKKKKPGKAGGVRGAGLGITKGQPNLTG